MEINSIKIRIHLPKTILRISCIITYLFCITSFPQIKEPRFEHLTVKDGLPEGTVKAMIQDYLGYMWFFTQYGLVKYDGYEMTVYEYSEDSTGLSGQSGISLYEDRNKTLWIGTWASGFNRFNRATETFKHYYHNPHDSSSIGSDWVYSMYEDRKGRFWLGTDAGLDLFDRKSDTFKHFYFSDRCYTKEIYNYILSTNKKIYTIESILKVGNNADITKTFTIEKKMQVLIVMEGEAGYDYGWLEDSKGKILFNYNYKKSLHAGGSFNNRIQCELITLNEGKYSLHFTSNYFYSYEDQFQRNSSFDYEIRTGLPPDHPELWGIQILNVSEDSKNLEELLRIQNNINVESKVFAIIEDEKSGQIYIGTNSPGIWKLNEKLNVIEKLNFSYPTKSMREIGSIETFYNAKDGNIWIATTVGLCKLDPSNKNLYFYQPTPSLKDIISNHLNSMTEDKDGNIWACTVLNGLLKFDSKDEKFFRYENDPKDVSSISSNKVLNVYFDHSGILWVGYWGTGASKWDKNKWKFQTYGSPEFKNALNNKVINTIYKDKNANLWLGTLSGLIKFDQNNNQLKLFSHSFNNINSICSDSIVCIAGDTFNPVILWIGTENGLDQFNTQTETLIHYKHKLGDPTSLSNNTIIHLLVDREGNVWVGAIGRLCKLDRETGKFVTYTGYNQAEGIIGSSNVTFIYEDKKGRLWIGYNGVGLLEFDKEDESFKPYFADINGTNLNAIQSICEDKFGNFWVGEYMQGLNLIDAEKGLIIKKYTTENGLLENRILYAVADDLGAIWFTNHSGLTRFDSQTKMFRHYNSSEGLVDVSFYSWYPLLKCDDGKIFFSGKDGLNLFNPADVEDDPTPPQVIIKKVSLFNRPDEKIEYDGFISELKELSLSYNQNDLSFQYVGFHYGEPLRNQYKYILEGFDEKWIDAGNLRTATYTNLDPGEYIFKVKAANRDGVWNEKGASIKIIINPPLWATTWAYLFYIILFGSILYYVWRMQLKRVRVKHEFEMSKFEAQKLHEVDEMKSRFFANISHEFRTPLTLILGPVKQVIERTKETKTKEDLNLVHRNAKRLLGLVNQLLDISKIESGNMKLQTAPINIIPYLKGLVLSFTSYAERKRISLNFVSDVNEIIVYIDKDKFEKIINNILSNAFKFTPEDGSIKVTVDQYNENLKIIVSDTGVGIPKEKLQKIFDRFFQVDGSHTREQEGTGIGLSLTKELVELHKGNIEVESEEGKGSSFIISIPLGTDHLKPDEIVELESDKIEQTQVENILANTPVSKTNLPDIDLITNTDKPILLIVEDNYDVRNYIRTNLDNGYRIIEAVDGEDGWNKSTNNLPDLIVSDVMMPKMDGFELCKRLKTDERTSHIPIILLTAKAAKQDKLDGYEIGADDYIMKPFEPDELSARIKNLIIQRKKLQEHFKKNGVVDFEQSHITSVDKKFLQNVLDRITQHISDSSFSVEMLAEDLGISRSVVHRKILSLTGETPGDLIRRIRLNKAASLIKSKFGNLSEIALEVGFNNPAHFSESFRKQFGYSPSHYQ